MQVILLERVDGLGTIGSVVNVRPGFARNFLLPQNKALRATEANLKVFEVQRAAIIARNAEARAAAEATGKLLEGAIFTLIRSAGDTGQLYGSVSARDIADAAAAAGHKVDKRTVLLSQPIKTIGLHDVTVRLHAEVDQVVKVNVARSVAEAERQAKGEDVIAAQLEADRADAAAQADEIAKIAAQMAEARGDIDR
jgi:large subunit ribosomal protein L9